MKKIIMGGLFIFSFQMLLAQIQADSIKTINIKEVEILSHQFLHKDINKAQSIQSISPKNIELAGPRTTADALQLNTNVFIQKSQQGGGSVTLRGFEASRVLFLVDGIRMNNLIYRAGHIQNIITLDPFAVEGIKVFLGPSSNLFGSDALGGVISVSTLLPKFSSSPKFQCKGKFSTGFNSVNQGTQNHLQFSNFNNKWSFNTSLTYSNFGDLKSGKSLNPFYKSDYQLRPFSIVRNGNVDSIVNLSNSYLQSGSGYSQIDFMEKIAYASDENTTHQLNLQYSNSSDVPRYDRLTEMSAGKPKFAEWKYGPQLRTMMAYDRNRKNKDGFFQTNHIGLNFQHVEESRISRKFNSNNLDRRNENVNVWGATAWAERKNGKQTTVVGGDIYLNFLESTADRTVISTGVLKPLDTRYPNGKNQMNLFGAYLEHRNVLSQKFQTQLGGRLGYSMLSSQLIDSTFFKFPFNAIQQNNLTYSGNLGLVYLTEGVESKNQWKFSFFQSTAFRAPNLDDLAKIFETAKGTLIVPNESLKPEKTWTNDLGINKIGEKLTWETHAYYTLFFDAIVTSPFQYQGKDSVVYDGVLSAVYANQNQRRAFVFGGNCQLTRKPSERLTWNSGINYTKGRIFSGDTTIPLDHIPPLQFSTDVNYHWGKFALRGQVQYQGKKELKDYLLNGEDNEQYATAEGMPAWVVVNLKGRVTLPRGLSVSGGIDNLFDTQYRVFASGINGPGRNLQITIRSTW